LYYWDIGLSSHSAKIVMKWCRGVYKRYPFQRYPSFQKKVMVAHAWKVAMIRDALKQYRYIIWADSSIRFWDAADPSPLQPLAMKHGIVGMETNGPISGWTNPRTFKALHVNMSDFDNASMIASGAIFIERDESSTMIDRWLDCATHEECIWPEKSGRWSKNGKIAHRDDQSVISIFLYQKHNHSAPYLQDDIVNKILRVQRGAFQKPPQKCRKASQVT
jgi:hypothetical protein